MIISRRSLITGLVSFLAAPAIVRASSIMSVKAWAEEMTEWVVTGTYPNTLSIAMIQKAKEMLDNNYIPYTNYIPFDANSQVYLTGKFGRLKVGDRIALTAAQF